MRYFAIVFAIMTSCGLPADASTATPTTDTPTTTGHISTTDVDESTSTSTTWTSAPTTGDAPSCQRDLCKELGEWCLDNVKSASICATLSEHICPGDPCAACEMAPKRCPFGDDACRAEVKNICAGVDQCECSYSCEQTVDQLQEDKQIALCFVYPWIIGEWCDEPDEAQCLAVMQGPCAPTACEYFDCLAALEEHPCEVPKECAAMHACGNLN